MENEKSDRITSIEGLFVSDELKELLKLWVNGEITLEEVEKKIYSLYLH